MEREKPASWLFARDIEHLRDEADELLNEC
jgi:hypothetical protein